MKIIGIGGTDGSGKDTLADMLVKKHNWTYVSVTDILRDEAARRGLSLERRNLRAISTEWRRTYGPAVLIDKAIQNHQTAAHRSGFVVASLRHPAEVKLIHKLGGKTVWVDADPQVRYKRITSRMRGTEDAVSFEQFAAEEKAQMRHHDNDAATLNLSAVKELADIHLENNGSDIKAFIAMAEKVLKGSGAGL